MGIQAPWDWPLADPRYYLSLSFSDPLAPQSRSVTARVHAASDDSLLLTIYGLDEMLGIPTTNREDASDFPVDKRFYWIPAAETLITIPPTNDRLVLRSLRIDPALDRGANEA